MEELVKVILVFVLILLGIELIAFHHVSVLFHKTREHLEKMEKALSHFEDYKG